MKKIIFVTFLIYATACKKETAEPTAPTPIVDNPSEQKTISLTVNGLVRTFVVYNPKGHNNAGKMPMIFSIHGGGGTPENMMQLADFKTLADRDKVVIVYPAGVGTHWNDGRPTVPNQQNINDVSFFNTMCDYMVTNYYVDNTKIYATGISNGGFMSSRLGCELSYRIAAIAVDAASIEQNTVAIACNPGRPMPAIFIQGTSDPLVPFIGGVITIGVGGTILSHADAVNKFISINGCSNIPIVTDVPDIANDGTTIKERRYSNATTGNEVLSYVVLNGGHTWPQGFQYSPENIIGKTSQDMNACEVIWAFFKRFKR
jgi:polyhydroxybutyrate depolymerase